MKALKIFAVVLLVINIALLVTFVVIKPPVKYKDNLKYNAVKVVHCKPNSDNITGKETYIYLSRFKKVEKVEELVVEQFDDVTKYQESIELKEGIKELLSSVEFIYDDIDYKITMKQTSDYSEQYLSLSEIMKYYYEHSCDFEEYYE